MSAGLAPAAPFEATGGSMNRAGALLVARDLAVTPPGAPEPVVRGMSMEVGPGEWVALVGPNGGGKTSLLLALGGLWPASTGSVLVDGVARGSESRPGAGLAVILQDPSSQLLQPSVAEELAFAARNLGQPEARIAAAVERWSAELGLAAELDRDPAHLSAGRQQLVLLAAALVAGPRILLADEPTAHLDAAARGLVREVIARQLGGGMAVVWATQDREEWEAATRTIWVGGSPVAGTKRSVERSFAETPSLVRIVITPVGRDDGPRIRVPANMEIELRRTGITAVVGPNGAGKSVLLAAAAGLSPSSQVAVEWTASPEHPPIVTLQYPELQIFEEVVADEVVFAATTRGTRRAEALARAARCLEDLGFEPGEFLKRRTWSLSTGEKRLIETVGSLICPAGLVLLDEPTAGLDPRRRDALEDLVVARAAEVPVFVASQDLAWVEGVGARVFPVGNQGRSEPPSPSRKRD